MNIFCSENQFTKLKQLSEKYFTVGSNDRTLCILVLSKKENSILCYSSPVLTYIQLNSLPHVVMDKEKFHRFTSILISFASMKDHILFNSIKFLLEIKYSTSCISNIRFSPFACSRDLYKMFIKYRVFINTYNSKNTVDLIGMLFNNNTVEYYEYNSPVFSYLHLHELPFLKIQNKELAELYELVFNSFLNTEFVECKDISLLYFMLKIQNEKKT